MGQNRKTSCDACGKYYYECFYSSNILKIETSGSYVFLAVKTESCPRCGEIFELDHYLTDDEEEINSFEYEQEKEPISPTNHNLYLVYNNSNISEVFLKRYAGFTFGDKKDTEGSTWDNWIEYTGEDFWDNIKGIENGRSSFKILNCQKR